MAEMPPPKKRSKSQNTSQPLSIEEQSSRMLFEAFTDAVFIANTNGRIVDCNSSAGSIFGYAPDDLVGITLAALLSERKFSNGHDFLETLLAKGSLAIEGEARRHNGEHFPVDISARLVKLDNAPRILAIFHDISDQKQAEHALVESQRALTSLLGHLPGMVFRCKYDEEWTLVFASGGSFALTGYPASAFLEKKQSYDALIHPEDRDLLNKVIKTGLWENGAYQFTYRLVTANGEVKWVWEQGWGLYNPKGELYAFEGMISDITERRMDEEQLLLQNIAVNTAANGIMITDRDGTVQWVNPAFSTMSGYAAEEVIGKNVNLVWTNQNRPLFFQSIWDTVLSGQPWTGEINNQRKDGSLYIEEMTVTPVRRKGGEITHLIAIKNDVSERKQREREQEAIARIASALRTAAEWDEIIQIIVRQTRFLMSAEGAAFITRNLNNDEVRCELGIGAWQSWTGMKLPPGKSPTDHVFNTSRTYVNNEVRPSTRIAHNLKAGELRAAACIPLLSEDKAIGVLWVGRKNDFTPGEVGVLNAIGDMASGAIHRASLHKETQRRLEQLSALHQIDLAISSTPELNLMLKVVFEQILNHLRADGVTLVLHNPALQSLQVIACEGLKKKGFLGECLDDTSIPAQVIHSQKLLSIPDISAAPLSVKQQFRLHSKGFHTYHGMPIIIKNETQGVLEIYHRRLFQPDAEWLNFLETLAGQAAIAIENATLFRNLQDKNIQLEDAYDHTLDGWSRFLELRDRETEGHTRRVVKLTLKMCKKLGMSEEQIVQVRRGATMHDIGKMAIPDDILLKKGPLNEAEWEVMRLHPENAYRILSEIEYLRPALDIPYCHHEHWDGTGYPRGLKGEEIPLAARIFAIADVWDALLYDRPYHKAMSESDVLAYICKESGKHFDPILVETFIKIVAKP
jgi:PAS domain S-box-containing protein